VQKRPESNRTCARPCPRCYFYVDPGIPKTLIYVVCTHCPFLRAYSTGADGSGRIDACPACGSALVVRETAGRFPPAYVSRVSLDLLANPELDVRSSHGQGRGGTPPRGGLGIR
jgi:hypothetical protein